MISKMAASHQDEPYKPRYFDPANKDHVQELKNWCNFHWNETLCKGIAACNAPTYHDCCICFCKKRYGGKNTHPPLQSASVLKIPELKRITSPDELYDWLRSKMIEHQRLGRRPIFPSINTPHIEHDTEEQEAEGFESAELLNKRCCDLLELQKNFEEKIRQLTEDNHRLLAASKSWCLKYQDLLCSRDDERMSFAEMTPQKALKIDDDNSSFLML
jgi:hypothetical protein